MTPESTLGVPARVIEIRADSPGIVTADVVGKRQQIRLGKLRREGVAPGEWVLAHLGYAFDRLTADEASELLVRRYAADPVDDLAGPADL